MSSLDFEIKRKSVHLVSLTYLFLFTFVEFYFNYKIAIYFLTFLLIIHFFYEEIRLRKARNFFEKYFKKYTTKLNQFHRLHEQNSMSGSFYMLLGIVISLSIFNYNIAIAVILMAIFGDLFAALVGKKFGKTKFLSKTLEGTTAGFLVNLIIAFIFLRGSFEIFGNSTLWNVLNNILTNFNLLELNLYLIFAAAFFASFAELYFENIDDNLSIPVFSGFFTFLIFIIFF